MNELAYRRTEQRLRKSVGQTPTEQLVMLPRLGVRVRVQEVGEGPLVLFIHGGPNSGSTWASLVEHIDGYRCIIVDRPGTGLSDPISYHRDTLPVFNEWYEALATSTDTMRNDGEVIGPAASLRGFDRSFTIPARVFGGVTAPTLFLWGTHDGFGGEDVARGVVDRMPDADLVMLPDSGHLPWLGNPTGVAAMTREFL